MIIARQRLLFPSDRPYVTVSTGQINSCSWEEAQQLGFVSKSASFKWTPPDLSRLRFVLKEIGRDASIIHTADAYYWISHHRFDGRVPKKSIRIRVNKMMNQREIKNVLRPAQRAIANIEQSLLEEDDSDTDDE